MAQGGLPSFWRAAALATQIKQDQRAKASLVADEQPGALWVPGRSAATRRCQPDTPPAAAIPTSSRNRAENASAAKAVLKLHPPGQADGRDTQRKENNGRRRARRQPSNKDARQRACTNENAGINRQ